MSKEHILLEFGDEIEYVLGESMGALLVKEVANSFHDNNLFQKWNIFLKPTTTTTTTIMIMNELLGTRKPIGQVHITDHKLHRHCYLCTGPRGSQFPTPASKLLLYYVYIIFIST